MTNDPTAPPPGRDEPGAEPPPKRPDEPPAAPLPGSPDPDAPPPGSAYEGWLPPVQHGLIRPLTGRHVAGVSGAVARATNTDPVLWRVLFAVTALLGGLGVLAYLVLWVATPAEGDTASPAEALVGRGRSSTSPFLVVVLAIVGIGLIGSLSDLHMPLLGLAVVLVILAIFARRRDATSPGVGVAPGSAASKAYAAPPTAGPVFAAPPPGYRPPFAPNGPFVSPAAMPPVPPSVKPPRSRLGAIAFSTILLALGVLAGLQLAGVVAANAATYFATALTVVGAALVLGAWIGRARGLIFLGVLLSIGLAISTTAGRWHDEHDSGSQRWTPATIAQVQPEYRFDLGDGTLDLRQVSFVGQQSNVRVEGRIGDISVLLPPAVDVIVRANTQVGDLELLSVEWSGVGGDWRQTTDLGPDGPGGGTLNLTLLTNVGDIEVTR
ncbi:PspC domain-containing protein [Pilimelia columellifera]|uniref:PspC domain-containing protein n=1 Tax=Pilimelia columellifera subsp. columellifera TaxID=706583 RepID=A0ABN3NLD8_9ACTN